MLSLNVVASEFVAVTSYCLSEEKGHLVKGGKYYAVDRALLEKLLDQNKYEESATKLAIWKHLRWIDADVKHLTKNAQLAGERRRMIVIDLGIHKQLMAFSKTKPVGNLNFKVGHKAKTLSPKASPTNPHCDAYYNSFLPQVHITLYDRVI